MQFDGLAKALCLSLVLHGLLVLAVADWAPPLRRPLGLEVRLLDAGAGQAVLPQPQVSAAQAASAAAAATERRPARARPRPARRSDALPQALPSVPAPSVPPRPAAAPDAAGDAANPPLAAAQPARSAATAGEMAPPTSDAAASAGIDADVVRGYQFALAEQARRVRRYPALARERGWEGRVRVGMAWTPGADQPSIRVLAGSGHALLDEQAVAMLTLAVQRTPLPEALRGRSFAFELPVEFSLSAP